MSAYLELKNRQSEVIVTLNTLKESVMVSQLILISMFHCIKTLSSNIHFT